MIGNADPGPTEIKRLGELITEQRLSSYYGSATETVQDALRLYEWNIEACAAVVATTAMVEVVVRNSMDAALKSWAARSGEADWLDLVPLDDQGSLRIAEARARAARNGKPSTHGSVIAELNFGFWRYLVARRYLTTLWIPALQHAFPYAPADPLTCQRSVDRLLNQLVFVRNRAAHHEPIHRRRLMDDFHAAVTVMAHVDPAAEAWVIRCSKIPHVMQARPDQ